MSEDKFLIEKLSERRWETYKNLAQQTGSNTTELYKRNLIYSRELYVIFAGFEVVVRNAFHSNLSQHFGKEDWMSDYSLFRKTHIQQIDNATKKVSNKTKSNYTIDDIIAELNFGFWAHLLDSPYEQSLWIPSLRHCFPYKLGKPVRQEIESKLKNILKIRNKIAHLEPVIKQEKQLMQAYQMAYDVISWICPKTADWFDQCSDFKKIWLGWNK